MFVTGPGESNEHHVAPRIPQRIKIDRHRLGVSEQKWSAQKQQDCRHQDRADRVDVLERVDGHSPQAKRGVIPQPMGYEAVCRFVQGDRENNRQHPHRCRRQKRIKLHEILAGCALRDSELNGEALASCALGSYPPGFRLGRRVG